MNDYFPFSLFLDIIVIEMILCIGKRMWKLMKKF